MTKLSLYIAFIIALVACTPSTQPSKNQSVSAEVTKENFIFAIQGKDTLSLDKYEFHAATDSTDKPVLLFAFGGGFKGGDKAYKGYISFFHFLARQGFVVVSTDYRTQLKDLQASEIQSPVDFMQVLQQAVDTAVTDFYDTTSFILSHHDAWNINPQQIIACGSSAGAITALQATYYRCNQATFALQLPDTFQYAGVISFAGAILDSHAPTWKNKPCPMLLFQGRADNIVPFHQATLDPYGGLWGSESIAESLKAAKASYQFHIVENAGHEIADLPLHRNQYDVMSFITRQIIHKESLVIETQESIPNEKITDPHFTLQDYLNNNLK